MAKATKINDENKTITLTSKSKNTTYTYDSSLETAVDVTISMSGDDIYTYGYLRPKNFAVRNGNNLVITTLYENKNTHKPKSITTTFKDFFSEKNTGINDIKFNSYYDGLNLKSYTINHNATAADGLFTAGSDTTGNDFILGTTKKDNNTFDQGGKDVVYDTKGNDTYISKKDSFDSSKTYVNEAYSSQVNVYDMKGNDIYSVENNSRMFVTDYAGNDKYTVKSELPSTDTNPTQSALKVYDYAGNDTYRAEKNAYLDSVDYKGNDKYIVDGAKYVSISDIAGKDTYNIKDLNGDNKTPSNSTNLSSIYEEKGNDTYTLDNTNRIKITDVAGKDNYTIKNTTFENSLNSKLDTRIEIIDKSGNDKYTLNNVIHNNTSNYSQIITDEAGKDTYKLTDVQMIKVKDSAGNDKWTVNGNSKLQIEDTEGKDKYTIDGTTIVASIADQAGNDTYNIKATGKKGVSYDSQSITISENKGNDKYNVQLKSDTKDAVYNIANLTITDKNGKDTYNFNKNKNATGFVYHVNIIDGTEGTNDGGNDTYNFDGYLKGKDISHQIQYVKIKDYGETNDTYNFNGIMNSFSDTDYDTAIEDFGGKNTYNIKNSTTFGIKSQNAGKDTYNITSSTYLRIDDYGQSDDTYKIKNSGGAGYTYIGITDEYGDDRYTIDSSRVVIEDKNGDDTYSVNKIVNNSRINDKSGTDTLKITGANAKNIVYMANIFKEGRLDGNGDLFIFDKSTNSYLSVENYYKADYSGTDAGCIETIKIGKKDMSTTLSEAYSYISSIKSEVASWLDTNDYSGVYSALAETNSDKLAVNIAYLTDKFAGVGDLSQRVEKIV